MMFTGGRYIPGAGGAIALEHEHRYRFCLDLTVGRTVLDLACGVGFGSAMIAERAELVWGVDVDLQAVSHARQNYQRANLQFLVGSCSAIPLADASVDVVVSFETIEHHDEHEAMLDEVRRVLRPDGVLIISSPDKRTYSGEKKFRNEVHFKELYAEEFAAQLEGRFKHVSLFGQRIVYGSAIILQNGPSEIRSYGIEESEPVSGLHDPICNIAIASDVPSWSGLARGGLMEEAIYRSEAVVERTFTAERQADALRLEISHAARMQHAEISELSRRLAAALRDAAVRSGQISVLRGEAAILSAELERLRGDYFGGSVLRRLAFHRRGKPRGWLRRLLLSDNKGTPRAATRRILFRKSGRVRPIFAAWYGALAGASQPPMNGMAAWDYDEFLRQCMSSLSLALAQTVHIVTTSHTEFVGDAFEQALAATRLKVTRGAEMPASFDHDLYVVVAPQMFVDLPPAEKLIIVQMEQVRASRWVDDVYLQRMHASLAVLDYSRDNIEALNQRGLPIKQLYHIPIRPLRRAERPNAERDIDVLFYGSIASDRRGRYIKALRDKLDLRVEHETFGQELKDILDRTKVVVNVHFYDEALLESTRLGQALSHGAFVVSEDAVDQSDYAGAFDGMVEFVPRNDVDAFVARVHSVLAAWRGPVGPARDEGFGGTEFHVLRALHGIGVLSLMELQDACSGMALPSDRLILALPEQVRRYDFARDNALPGAAIFTGLRHVDGWRGCASSYKFLATHALATGMRYLTVYEDDAIFQPDAQGRLLAIEPYLKARDDWDIFSGLITDLNPEASITAIHTQGGEELIELDSLVGMVFGIYSRRGLELLAAFEFEGSDTARHTIDRYLESRGPRTMTLWPPLVGHEERLDSSIWPVSNSQVASMISLSMRRLAEKRAAFQRQSAANQAIPHA
jgi:SAM-dependent methyltransferase/GR25 family glycosyltransferase involved in LPS biosynthesis